MKNVATPKVGTIGSYCNGVGPPRPFKITRVEGNICWAIYDEPFTAGSMPFIWRFSGRPALNTMHDWPGKPS